MIGVYFFLLFAGYTIFIFIQGRRSWSGPLLACHGFSAISKKKIQSQKIWLVCSATTSIWALGWTFVVLGFQDGVQVFTFCYA